MSRIHVLASPLLALAAALLLATAGPASALYIQTPLRLHSETRQAEVGDVVSFDIEPENESVAAEYARGEVIAVAWYDPNEGRAEDPDQPASSDEEPSAVRLVIQTVTLRDDATGSFGWEVPSEVDDKNVAIRLEDADGELLAVRDLVVGDAEPMMRIAAGPGGGEPVDGPVETPVENEEPPADAPASDTRGVPGAAAALVVSGVAAAALALRRR